jgi:antitoxin HigA-1
MTKIISDRYTMQNPPHPGEVLNELYVKPLRLTVTEAAKALDISRKNLSGILNGRGGISTKMAMKIALCFNTSAESWLNMQQQYNLWQNRQNDAFLKRVTVLYTRAP